MEQTLFHPVIDFWKVSDGFLGTAGRQVLEKSVLLSLLRFIPLVFQHHPCQLLAVDELLYFIPAVSPEQKNGCKTHRPCHAHTK